METAKTIEKAFNFASEKHEGQLYGSVPYITHLISVYSFLQDVNDVEVWCAGLLHDTLEDTNTSREELCDNFNKRVADIVFYCTDEDGKNRKEKKAKTYKKFEDLVNQNQELAKDVSLVKLADRLANVINAQHRKNLDLLKMYQKEQEAFKKTYYIKDLQEKQWQTLDRILEEHEIKNSFSNIELKFDHYHNHCFYFKGELPDGRKVTGYVFRPERMLKNTKISNEMYVSKMDNVWFSK